jgi:hypothetical protein
MSTFVRIFQYEYVYFRHPGLSTGDFDGVKRKLFGPMVVNENKPEKSNGGIATVTEDQEKNNSNGDQKKPHPRSKDKKRRK